GAAVSDLQRGTGADRRSAAAGVRAGEDYRSGIDRRATAVGIVRCQSQRPGPQVGHGTGPRYLPGECHVVGVVECEGAVIHDSADDTARRAAVAQLQGSGADGGSTGIEVGAGEDQRSRTLFDQRAASRNHIGIGVVIRTVECQRPGDNEIAIETSGRPARTDQQSSAQNRGCPRVSHGAGQGQCAGTLLDQGTRAGDVAGNREIIGPVEVQNTVVNDVAYDTSGDASI